MYFDKMKSGEFRSSSGKKLTEVGPETAFVNHPLERMFLIEREM
jgi:hypothetical protein